MRRSDLLPLLTLLGLVLLGVAGWLLFPWFNHLVHTQDCIAAGREDC